MLTKCANPKCRAEFHRLGEGRLFEVNFEEAELRRKAGVSGTMHMLRKESRGVERFWLCGECAKSMTLVVNVRTNRVALAPVAEEKPKSREAAMPADFAASMPPQSALLGGERLAVS